LVARLSGGGLPIAEPGLVELIDRHRQRLTFSSDVGALRRCDIVYAAQDVPTDEAGGSDLSPGRALIERTAQALNPQGLLVVLCQVPPGFPRALPIAPARRYYQVETLVFGRAVERALNPERIILGCADPGSPLDGRLSKFLDAFECPVLPMR